MEAAHTLAGRGHHVDLYEKSAELGGQWTIAGKAEYKSDFRTLVPWMLNAMKQTGVNVHTWIADFWKPRDLMWSYWLPEQHRAVFPRWIVPPTAALPWYREWM